MTPRETKRDTDSIDALKKEIAQKQEKIRRMKRTDSEINLQLVADKITSDNIDDIKEVMKACYDYIAQHRALTKQKDTFVELDED